MKLPAAALRASRGCKLTNAIASTPSGHGYWLLNASGQVFNFGDALSLGNFPAETGDVFGTRRDARWQRALGRYVWRRGCRRYRAHARERTELNFGNFASEDESSGQTMLQRLVAPTNGKGLWGLSPTPRVGHDSGAPHHD